jgi:hypothetical protein
VSEQKTIFEGLYQIDWSQALGYDPNSPYIIPHIICNLLADNPFTRDDARTFLFEEVIQQLENPLDPLHHIFDFAMETLELAELPDLDKACLVELWRLILEHDRGRLYAMQKGWAVYKILEPYIPHFLRVLETPHTDLRFETVLLLGQFTENQLEIIPCLVEQFHHESQRRVQIALLEALGNLLTFKHMSPEVDGIRKKVMPMLWTVAQTHSSISVRCAAAYAGVQIAYYVVPGSKLLEYVPSYIAPLLGELFWQIESDNLYQTDIRAINKKKTELLRYLKLLPNAQEHLTVMLQAQPLPKVDRQLIEQAMGVVPEPERPPFLNRIGDMLLNTLKPLLPYSKD